MRAAQAIKAIAIQAQEFWCDGDLRLNASFAVHEKEVTGDATLTRGINHLRREYLQGKEIKSAARDHRQPLLEALRKEKVRKNNHDTAAASRGSDEPHRLFESRRAFGFKRQ